VTTLNSPIEKFVAHPGSIGYQEMATRNRIALLVPAHAT